MKIIEYHIEVQSKDGTWGSVNFAQTMQDAETLLSDEQERWHPRPCRIKPFTYDRRS